MKFTPGPWKMELCHQSTYGWSSRIAGGNKFEGRIAITVTTEKSASQANANANLIEKTPDLLERLRELTAEMDNAGARTTGWHKARRLLDDLEAGK